MTNRRIIDSNTTVDRSPRARRRRVATMVGLAVAAPAIVATLVVTKSDVQNVAAAEPVAGESASLSAGALPTEPTAVSGDIGAATAASLGSLWLKEAACEREPLTLRGAETRDVRSSKPEDGDVTVAAFGADGGIVDRAGPDVLVRGTREVQLPGEAIDATADVVDGDAVVLVNSDKDAFAKPYRVSPEGALSEVSLPKEALGAWEIEHLPGGGAVVSLVERLDGEFADVVNAWHLDTSGNWSRLTKLSGTADSSDGLFSIVESVRETAAGTVVATVFRAAPNGDSSTFRSQRLTVGASTRSAELSEPVVGELIFDQTADGRQLMGVSRVASIDWFEPAQSDAGSVGCEQLPSSQFAPDPDL